MKARRGAAIGAWSLFAASTALGGGAVFLLLRNSRDLISNSFVLLAAVSFPLVGALVASRQPRNALGWIFSAAGLSVAVGLFAEDYARYALLTDPGALPGGAAMAWLASWIWVIGFAVLLTLAPLLFPDGKPPSPRWRAVVACALSGVALFVVAGALTWPYRGLRLLEVGEVPEASLANTLATVGLSAIAVSAPASLVALIVRYRRSRGTERLQLKWFAYGAALSVTLVLVSQVVQIEEFLLPVAVLLIPATVAVAILRYRLYDIDVVINRSVVYATLTGVIFAAYVAAVALFDQLAHRTGSAGRNRLGPSLIVAVLVALLFQPLRERVQRTANRLMYGLRNDPYAAMSRVGERFETPSGPNDLLPGLVQTVAEALRLPYVAIELGQNGEVEQSASYGSPVSDLLSVSLVYQGRTVGSLVVSQRSPVEPLSTMDRRLLADLARYASVAAHATQLAHDLQRSRERLVGTREEERRRLRRDLHDGLGPSLAGITLELEAARNQAAEAPVATTERLGKIASALNGTIAEVRRLVDGLRPPALDELGLVASIRQEVARFGPLTVAVETTGDLSRLPAAVEVAAYRIVLEAVVNAARHADATRCVVRLVRSDTLDIEIEDDGHGIPSGALAGVGLASMRERAEELGGTCVVEASPVSGALVRAHIPLRTR